MTLYKKILSLFIFSSFALMVWFFSWLDHPIPIYEGEINLKGLDKPVDVYFDK